MKDSTRSLLFGVFVLAGTPLTAAEVIRLIRPLGVSATNTKSHLSRLVAEGALVRRGPARARLYTPSRGQSTVIEGIRMRLRPEPLGTWDGTWIALTLRLPPDRRRRERLGASLWFDGFRLWAPGTFVRPTWPEPWACDRARDYLTQAPGFCLRGSFIESLDLRRVASLYELTSLDRQARALTGWVRRKRARQSNGERTLALRLEVGNLVTRLVSHDPRLPRELWGQRRGMLDLVKEYDRFDSQLASRSQQFLKQVLAERSARVGQDG